MKKYILKAILPTVIFAVGMIGIATQTLAAPIPVYCPISVTCWKAGDINSCRGGYPFLKIQSNYPVKLASYTVMGAAVHSPKNIHC